MSRREVDPRGATDERTYPVELALLEPRQETGFWDDNGRPAPWPDDIDEWRPTVHDPITPEPREPPF